MPESIILEFKRVEIMFHPEMDVFVRDDAVFEEIEGRSTWHLVYVIQ